MSYNLKNFKIYLFIVILKNMKRGYILLIILFILFSCEQKEAIREVIKIGKDTPFAIIIHKERSLYKAQNISERITNLGFDNYLIFNDNIDDGEWYYIISNAFKNRDSIDIVKKDIEQKINIKINNLKSINFSDTPKIILNIDSLKAFETKRINSLRPNIKADIFDIVEMFPENNSLFVDKSFVINSPKDNDSLKYFNQIYDMKLDLPRGVSRELIMKNTSAFVEVIYRDNLYGDRVTIDIGKLKKINKIQNSSFLYFDNDSNEEISSYYADLILNTGDYTIESKEKISINGKYNFSGYKVKIETKKNIIRTYMVLVDNNNDYLLFSQSTDKSEEDLIDILTEVGNGDGLLSYDEFYNVFFTIPYNIMNNDLFLGFTLSKLNNSYAESKNYEKWARLYVGHWAGQVYFRNFQKGNWSYGIYDTQTSSKNQRINSLYENSYNFEKVNVQNTYGNLVMERWDSKVSEINFVVDRYTCMINNTQYSRLSKNDLINRANLIQLNK